MRLSVRIELRGIIVHRNGGHKYVDLVVTEDRPDKYRKHRMGVDIKLNRGKINTFLSGVYGIKPGDIVWPGHITI
ncbi:hypothetical protein ES702_05090 [subsurface metagenome]